MLKIYNNRLGKYECRDSKGTVRDNAEANDNCVKNINYCEFLNVTNEMQLLKTLLLSLLYMFRELLAHYQELTKNVRAAYSDDMR